MDKEKIKKALAELKKSSKRNFKQSIDIIIVLKNLDLKKPDQQVEFYQQMHFGTGRKIKVCALVGSELLEQAKSLFDKTIGDEDFHLYEKDKKLTKKLAKEHDFFIAQASIMPKVATTFGRVLGPAGKMPNPKAGCVVPPNANLKPLVERLRKTIKISAKTILMIQKAVGKEDSDENEVIDNFMTIYDGLVHHLPAGIDNIRKVMIKLTMSKPIKLE